MIPLRSVALTLAKLALTACITGTNESQHATEGGALSLFVLGVWHGIIGPITLIGEIIEALSPHALTWEVHFYETHGSGVVYAAGFFLGLVAGPSVLLGGFSRRARV